MPGGARGASQAVSGGAGLTALTCQSRARSTLVVFTQHAWSCGARRVMPVPCHQQLSATPLLPMPGAVHATRPTWTGASLASAVWPQRDSSTPPQQLLLLLWHHRAPQRLLWAPLGSKHPNILSLHPSIACPPSPHACSPAVGCPPKVSTYLPQSPASQRLLWAPLTWRYSSISCTSISSPGTPSVGDAPKISACTP